MKKFLKDFENKFESFEIKIYFKLVTILYDSCRNLGEVFGFKCLWKTFDTSSRHVLYIKHILQEQRYSEHVELSLLMH
eukprot:UN28023